MGDEERNNMQNRSRYAKSGVSLALYSVEDLISMLLPARLGVVPVISKIVNWLLQEIFLMPNFSRWFPPSPLISLCIVLNSSIPTKEKLMLSLSISPSHGRDLIQRTAYPMRQLHPALQRPRIDLLPLAASLLPLKFPWQCCTQFHHFSQLWVNIPIRPRIMSSHTPDLLPPDKPATYQRPSDWPRQMKHPISLNYCPAVHLWVHTILGSKCISNPTWSHSPSASPNLLDYSIQFCMIIATTCISKLTRSQRPSASLNSLNHSFQVYI